MARPKKSAQMEIVLDNLKVMTYAEIEQLIAKATAMLDKKKAEQIEALETEIAEKQAKLATLKKGK